MIITLKGANFSGSNVGTLSTWLINKSLKGVTTTSTVTSVDKDGSYTATFKVADGYELYSEYVTMGGVDITQQLIWSDDTTATLTISKVTGNVYINIVANSESEEEEPVYYTITYKYVDSSGNTIGANTTEQVLAGTSKTFNTSGAIGIDGYTISSVSPTSATVNSNITVTYTYTVNATSGASYWISEKLTGNTIGSGTPNSLLGAQYFVIRDTNYIAELVGKTVESVAIGLKNAAVANGSLKIYLVDINNEAPANWILKDTITGWSGEASTVQIKDLNTPFVVPSGYTLGYQAPGLLGAGTVTEGHSRDEYYYNSVDATSASKLAMAPFDVKVKA